MESTIISLVNAIAFSEGAGVWGVTYPGFFLRDDDLDQMTQKVGSTGAMTLSLQIGQGLGELEPAQAFLTDLYDFLSTQVAPRGGVDPKTVGLALGYIGLKAGISKLSGVDIDDVKEALEFGDSSKPNSWLDEATSARTDAKESLARISQTMEQPVNVFVTGLSHLKTKDLEKVLSASKAAASSIRNLRFVFFLDASILPPESLDIISRMCGRVLSAMTEGGLRNRDIDRWIHRSGIVLREDHMAAAYSVIRGLLQHRSFRSEAITKALRHFAVIQNFRERTQTLALLVLVMKYGWLHKYCRFLYSEEKLHDLIGSDRNLRALVDAIKLEIGTTEETGTVSGNSWEAEVRHVAREVEEAIFPLSATLS